MLLTPPRQVWVWQHVRFKYGCRHCKRHQISAPVVRADMPPQLLPGSVASAATISTVMTSKYADGMPLYRMEQVFHRAGLQIGRGTMGHWLIGASQRHLQRLYDAMHHALLTQPLIHGDETTVQVSHEAGRQAQSKATCGPIGALKPALNRSYCLTINRHGYNIIRRRFCTGTELNPESWTMNDYAFANRARYWQTR